MLSPAALQAPGPAGAASAVPAGATHRAATAAAAPARPVRAVIRGRFTECELRIGKVGSQN